MHVREIENRLLECANVREVCVLSPQDFGEARYRAFVVLGKDRPDSRQQFHAHCNVHLRGMLDMIDIHVLGALPRTPVGAVSRRALTELGEAQVA